MTNSVKYIHKKTIRIDDRIKSIIEKNFREICHKTGLRLSYGKIARAFWLNLAENKKLRKQCMELVCKSIIRDYNDKRRKSRKDRGRNKKTYLRTRKS